MNSLVEGLTLADLLTEELGAHPEPDRIARRSARGPVPSETGGDPRDARIAALERTVAQLEHALAARVSTERAIGVLAERTGSSPRAAFEEMRQQARSSGRPVAELAREVLASLNPDEDEAESAAPTVSDSRRAEQVTARSGIVLAVPTAPGPRPRPTFARRVEHAGTRSGTAPGASGDGRS